MLQDRLDGLATCCIERISWTTFILKLWPIILHLGMNEESFFVKHLSIITVVVIVISFLFKVVKLVGNSFYILLPF
jgi:hypothetical protein